MSLGKANTGNAERLVEPQGSTEPNMHGVALPSEGQVAAAIAHIPTGSPDSASNPDGRRGRTVTRQVLVDIVDLVSAAVDRVGVKAPTEKKIQLIRELAKGLLHGGIL